MLKEFLAKNEINLPDPIFSLCEEGIEIMRGSVDPIHDETHVLRIINDLGGFLREEIQVDKQEINFKILLLSICWHDVWKSKRFPANPPSLLFDQLWEGLGSVRIFTKRASGIGLESDLIHKVNYSIRKHSRFQTLPIKTLEAAILKDLDNLEEWSLVKLGLLKEKFLVSGEVNPRLLRLAKFWFDHFMTRTTDSAFHFQWSKNEFAKRKELYLEEVGQLLLEYSDYL